MLPASPSTSMLPQLPSGLSGLLSRKRGRESASVPAAQYQPATPDHDGAQQQRLHQQVPSLPQAAFGQTSSAGEAAAVLQASLTAQKPAKKQKVKVSPVAKR